MIITIDISQIVYNTGVSRYTRELVRHLLRIDKKNHYKLFAGTFRAKRQVELFAEELRDENLDFDLIIKNFPPKLAQLVWNKWHIFPIENFVGKTDIFHTSDWTQPPIYPPNDLVHTKKITTVHDLTPLLFPEYHEQSLITNFKRNLKLIEKECSQIICVSQSTKNDLLKFINFDENNISVIYNGVVESFNVGAIGQSRLLDKIAKTKQKFGINKKYLLSVATLEPRKNIKLLVQAFQKLNLPDYQLVLSGKYGWGDNNLPQDKNVIYTGFVDDCDLPSLYCGAEAFVYPSLYEGFGLPVLESVACGTPVITSNVSSLPEIVGDAGILINPKNLDELAQAIQKLLTSEKLRKNLSAKALAQASKFTWEKCARQTLRSYEQQEKK